MDYAQMKAEKDARLAEHNEKYESQLRLQRFIESLERDNDNIRNADNITTNRQKRRAKKLIKINDKDIKTHKKALEALPPVPPFK